MQSGKAPIDRSTTGRALLSRQWSRRRPLPAGLLSLLTVGFWAVWLYLVMPLVSLLLWVFGVRLFLLELVEDGYEGLSASLVAYSWILLGLVAVLVLWIVWNVMRYGGSNDRRTAKREEVADQDVQKAFRLDASLLDVMRDRRLLCVDLDSDGCLLMVEAASPPRQIPAATVADAPDGRAPAQRDRGST